MSSATIQVRVDNATRQAADDLFASRGLNTQTAVKIFLNRAIEYGGLPFEVAHREITYDMLNQETLDAISELDGEVEGGSAKHYDSFSELLAARK